MIPTHLTSKRLQPQHYKPIKLCVSVNISNEIPIILIWFKISSGIKNVRFSAWYHECYHLLPTGSEERGVLGVGSIPVAILASCQK